MKKHFIFLGAAGLIYYSWLLALVFVGVIFAYESNKALSLVSLCLCGLFGILLIFTWFNSFIQKQDQIYLFKLPYRKKQEISKPELVKKWHKIKVYEIKDSYQKYYVVTL